MIVIADNYADKSMQSGHYALLPYFT